MYVYKKLCNTVICYCIAWSEIDIHLYNTQHAAETLPNICLLRKRLKINSKNRMLIIEATLFPHSTKLYRVLKLG